MNARSQSFGGGCSSFASQQRSEKSKTKKQNKKPKRREFRDLVGRKYVLLLGDFFLNFGRDENKPYPLVALEYISDGTQSTKKGKNNYS